MPFPEITEAEPQVGGPTTAAQRELNLLDIAIVIATHKRLVTGIVGVATAAAIVLTLLMPNIYTGRTKILPPQHNKGMASSMIGQLAPLAGLALSDLAVKDQNELYVAMLKSSTVANRIIDRFRFHEIYKMKLRIDTETRFAKASRITTSRDGIITIEFDDPDSKRAADVANAYVEELRNLTRNLALSEASQRRLFFEEQVKNSKDQLANAEVELKKTQEATGLIIPDSQARATVESIAILRAQVAAKEVQLRAMRSFATEEHPDLVRVTQELAGLRSQLIRLQRGASEGPGDIYIATKNVPEAGLAYLRKLRDVKYHETVFELLAKQYELARLDEAKEAALIQVLDRATPPERKSKPPRTIIVLVTFVVSTFIAIFLALVVHAATRMGSNSDNAARLQVLRRLVFGDRSFNLKWQR